MVQKKIKPYLITKFDTPSVKSYYRLLYRQNIIALASESHTIQPVQDLRIGIPLHDHIRHRYLHLATILGDPTTNSSDNTKLHLRSKAVGRLGNKSNVWCAAAGEVGGGEVVEPEDAADASGAVVDVEFEEFVGFEVSGGDGTDCLGAGEEGAVAGEGVGGGEGSEREEIESQELYVGVVERVFHGKWEGVVIGVPATLELV